MQKKLVYVLVLMSTCVLGITSLQLYWNYKNYHTVVTNFKNDINVALANTIELEKKHRRSEIINELKSWMADTSIFKITADTLSKDHETRFTIADAVPYYPDEKPDSVSIGINNFKEKLAQITPEAKQIFIAHFSKIVDDDLKNGSTFYYTQGLGHRIEKVYNQSKVNIEVLAKTYKEELQKKNINTSFKISLNEVDVNKYFLKEKINTSFKSPYNEETVWVGLENPNSFYFREMRWLILCSFLLIGITLFCFYYTILTLFNQYKLVKIKNEFINNMTHEINTPLSSIQITTEALQKLNPDLATREKYLEIIAYQTKKLNELTNEILANAKLENLSYDKKDEVNLNQLLLNIIDDFEMGNKIQVIHNLSNANVVIIGNQMLLKRSIVNILENSIKYNTAKTPVINVNLIVNQRDIKLFIADNGPGIEDEYKLKIFDQFYRIPTGNIHNTKGYGLGLNYVKKVIDQHHGTIQVLDNNPTGCIFVIQLPK